MLDTAAGSSIVSMAPKKYDSKVRHEGRAGINVRRAMESAFHAGGVLGKSVKAKAKSKPKPKAESRAESRPKAKAKAKPRAKPKETKSSSSTACSSASTRRPRVTDDTPILDLLPKAKRPRSTKAEKGENIIDAVREDRADRILRLGKFKNVMPRTQWTYPPGVQPPDWADKILVCIDDQLQVLPRQDVVINTWSDCA